MRSGRTGRYNGIVGDTKMMALFTILEERPYNLGYLSKLRLPLLLTLDSVLNYKILA